MPLIDALVDNFDDDDIDLDLWASSPDPCSFASFYANKIQGEEDGSCLKLEIDNLTSDSVVALSSFNDDYQLNGSADGTVWVQIKDIGPSRWEARFSVGNEAYRYGHFFCWSFSPHSSEAGLATLVAGCNEFGDDGVGPVSIHCPLAELRGLWLGLQGDGADVVWLLARNDRGVRGTPVEIRREGGLTDIAAGAVSLDVVPVFAFGEDSVVRYVWFDNFNYEPSQGSAVTHTVHTGTSGTSSTLTTGAVTPTGDNRAVVVAANSNNSANANAELISYNNSSGDPIDFLELPYDIDLFAFAYSYLDVNGGIAAPNTSSAIYADFPGTPENSSVSVVFFQDVDQTTPFGTESTDKNYITSNSVPRYVYRTFTGLDPYQAVVAVLAIFVVGENYNFTIDEGPNTLLIRRDDGSVSPAEPRWVNTAILLGHADEDGNATVSAVVNWTWTTADQLTPYRIVAIPLNHAAGGPPEEILCDVAITESDDTTSATLAANLTLVGAVTEGDDATSSAVTVLDTLNGAVTEGNDTLASTVTSGVLSAAITEADDTSSSTVTVLDTLNAAITEANDSSSGTVINAVTTTSAITEGNDALASTVTNQVTTNASVTEGDDSLSSNIPAGTGILTANIQEANDTVTSAVLNAIVSIGDLLEGHDTVVSELIGPGVIILSLAVTEGQDVLTSTALNVVSSLATIVEAGDTTSVTVEVTNTLNAALQETGDTLASFVTIAVICSASMTEAADTLVALLRQLGPDQVVPVIIRNDINAQIAFDLGIVGIRADGTMCIIL